MSWSPQREEEVFHGALDIVSGTERAAYLQRECGGDAGFLDHIRELLEAAEHDEGLLGGDDDPETPAGAGIERVGEVIDRYRLERRIADGAMGVVYEAEQLRPFRRRVALKIIKAGMDSEEVVARFNTERQVLAVLDHPNVARVLDGGTTPGGRPFFVMELVPGEPVTRFCDDHKLTIEQRLKLFIAVCHGVQHAHQRGIIHRDLKPSNVLVMLVDNEPVPVVIDFGVAKAVHQELFDSTLATRPGHFVGTPTHMSPEQVAGSEADIDTRSDVYALGVLLYELLTGTIPFPKMVDPQTNWVEIQRIILKEEPQWPSRRMIQLAETQSMAAAEGRATTPRHLQQRLRNDLDWIVLATLEKDRERRYKTVGDLIADVQRHLECRAVSVGAPGWTYLAAKFVRRNRTLAIASAVMLLTAMIAGTLAVSKSLETRQALIRVDASFLQLEVRTARELLDANRISEGLPLLANLVRAHPDDLALSTWLVNELTLRNFPKPLIPPMRHPDIVNAVHFSPDGRRLLTTCIDNAARVFDAATGDLLVPPLQHRAESVTPGIYNRGLHALHARFNRDGSMIATASCDTTARVWDARTGEPLTPWLKHPDLVSFAIFSPAEDLLVTGCRDGKVRFWSLPDGALTGKALEHDDWVNCAEFSPDGTLLLTGADDHTARLWEVGSRNQFGPAMRDNNSIQQARFSHDGTQILTSGASDRGLIWNLPLEASTDPIVLQHGDNVPYACFSDDSRWITTASFDGAARIWSAADGRLKTTMAHAGNVRFAHFSADGLRLVTASEDGTAGVWDVETGIQICAPLGHRGIVWHAEFSPDGSKVATASADGTAVLWDVRPGQALPLMLSHEGTHVGGVSWSSTGEWVVTSGSRGATWNTQTGVRVGEPNRWLMPAFSHAIFHPTKPLILVGNISGSAEVWPLAPGDRPLVRVIHRSDWDDHRNAGIEVDWAPDGNAFLTVSNDQMIRVWGFPSGEKAGTAQESESAILTTSYSRDGRWIVGGLADGRVKLWAAADLQSVKSWKAHQQGISVLSFSSNGHHVISGSADGTAAVWTFPDGKQIGTHLVHQAPVTDAALTSDGRRAVTASRDHTARIWNVPSGQPVGAPLQHRSAVLTSRIDPIDRHVVTTSEDRTARVWDLNTGYPAGPPLRHLSRVRHAEFSPDGTRLLTASDGMACIWPLILPSTRAPGWLPDLAEKFTSSAETLVGVSETEPSPSAFTLEAGSEADTSWMRWRTWIRADRIERAHSPDATVSTRQLSDVWLKDAAVLWDLDVMPVLSTALQLQPTNLIGRARLEAIKLVRNTRPNSRATRSTHYRQPRIEGIPAADPITAWIEALQYLAQDEPDRALRRLEPFLDEEGMLAMYWFTATHLLFGAGRIEEAKQSFAKAITCLNAEENNYLPRMYERRAMMLWATDVANRNQDNDARWFVRQISDIPSRPEDTTPELIDLTSYFNGPLRFPWFR